MRHALMLAAVLAAAGCGGTEKSAVAPSAVAVPADAGEAWSAQSAGTVTPPAAATIRLTGGSVGQVRSNGSIDLEGTRGFSLVGGFDSVWGGLRVCDEQPDACRPGETLAFSLYRTGNDMGAIATLEGATYRDVGSTASDYYAGFDIRATIVFPRFGRRTSIETAAPCTVTGYLGGGGISETFAGRGKLRVSMHQQHEVGDYWAIDRVDCVIKRH